VSGRNQRSLRGNWGGSNTRKRPTGEKGLNPPGQEKNDQERNIGEIGLAEGSKKRYRGDGGERTPGLDGGWEGRATIRNESDCLKGRWGDNRCLLVERKGGGGGLNLTGGVILALIEGGSV